MEASYSRFTPPEGGARLAAKARTHNSLVTDHAAFVAMRLLYEEAYGVRGTLSDGKQRSVYITRQSRVKCVTYDIGILTDLTAVAAEAYDDVHDWAAELHSKEVLVCTSAIMRRILEEELLSMANINVLIIDSCHLISKDEHLQYIMKIYKQCEDSNKPRILSLTYPLFSSIKKEYDTQNDASDNKNDNSENDTDATVSDGNKNYTELSSEEIIGSKNEAVASVEMAISEEEIKATECESNDKVSSEAMNIELSTNDELSKNYEIELDHKFQIGVYKNLDDFKMYEKLEWKIDVLEEQLCCQADLAEDIDGGKRLTPSTTKPKEWLIEYNKEKDISHLPEDYLELEKYMLCTVHEAIQFLDDHRYDPTEIYGEDLYEELKSIPDPTVEPKLILYQFLYVLDELGPYGADKAAFSLLTKIEKLRIKVPYERHFLLLCMCTSVFVKIRCYADLIFAEYETEWEKIKHFSTPKLMRLVEILEKFKPPNITDNRNYNFTCNENKNDNLTNENNEKQTLKTKLLNEIDSCDFTTLGDKIEDQMNTIAANLKEIEIVPKNYNDAIGSKNDNSSSEVENTSDNLNDKLANESDMKSSVLGFAKRPGHRTKGRSRVPRSNLSRTQQMLQNPDALCGIVFMKEPLMAKILFSVIVELSRGHPDLAYLSAQYSALNIAPSVENEPQRRKQEEVLKKFRMHECNLLLATASLEEGIDLPRCNLVLRWDTPPSYVSHKLCRARARAPRAAAAALASHAAPALQRHAAYAALDQIVTRKCGCGVQDEPTQCEENYADDFTTFIKPYIPDNANDKNSKNNEKCRENDKRVNENLKCEKCSHKNDESVSESFECDKCKHENDDVNKNDAISDRNKNDENSDAIASVDMSSAIALINRYCGKLPSDTFTRLTPHCSMECIQLPDRRTGLLRDAYICTLRLPLNCPVKYNIVGHPMPSRVLARRVAALQTCRVLHKQGELDERLMPIGKENFKAVELDIGINNQNTSTENNDSDNFNDAARPGTTKRRQYYYKRTAKAFTNCEPIVDCTDEEVKQPYVYDPNGKPCNALWAVRLSLRVPLPARYNTRARRLHAPQHADHAHALLHRANTDRLQIPEFPVYTRSGEVLVSVERAPHADTRLSPTRARRVRRFMRFVFAEVLRVRRRGMALRSAHSHHNNYYIVPTIKKSSPSDGTTIIDIDWDFIDVIYNYTEERKYLEIDKSILWHQDDEEIEDFEKNRNDAKDFEKNRNDANKKDTIDDKKCDSDTTSVKSDNLNKTDVKSDKNQSDSDGHRKVKKMANPHLKPGEVFVFDPDKYKEAVVTPWYRNQDQPQFFLVAEICWNLTPDSAFPSATHSTFRSYYQSKYGVELTQENQPLLDVDHTSARLNLLTPRYVNRKGVALPVSSERTRRAKRDRLDQKQILVPELCSVHPFPASLWFATVALPCVLYRINALLIADEIRQAVALEVGLGLPKIEDPEFKWPPLDFGWSLAEVLNADAEKIEKIKEEDCNKKEDLVRERRLTETIDTEVTNEEDSDIIVKEKTINDILQEKEDAESGFEIGTWCNEMAASIPDIKERDEYMEPLPSNLTFCTSASGGTNWCEPVEKPRSSYNPTRTFSMADSDCSYMSSDFDTDDSDLDSVNSDDEDTSGFCSSRNSNAAMGVRIEYKTAHEAEAVDLERKKNICTAPQPSETDDLLDRCEQDGYMRSGDAPEEYLEKFHTAIEEHKENIQKRDLITKGEPIHTILPEPLKDHTLKPIRKADKPTNEYLDELFPFANSELKFDDEMATLESIEKNKRQTLEKLKKQLSKDDIDRLNCFSMVDVDVDEKLLSQKQSTVGERILINESGDFMPYYMDWKGQNKEDVDYQPNLNGHPGPSPSVILQALTMSNANDGINLERLETIGDSFLKFAITAYLYCTHSNVHEGKLSHMRSKQVSNLNLYRLGRDKNLGQLMIASKFEPHDNWLPPCHAAPAALDVRNSFPEAPEPAKNRENDGCYIPYNLITQHSIPDKSIADCVEALIGAYLIECGGLGALLFMTWLGIRVLPTLHDEPGDEKQSQSLSKSHSEDSDFESSNSQENTKSPTTATKKRPIYGALKPPPSPLLRHVENPEGELEQMLSGYEKLEETLKYRFKERSLLLQAMSHASYQRNRLTDCYQRLELLGDAILDYLITRWLYSDSRRHSPGALTDLRSALVNNTIFATLAVRHGFHKFFRHMSPGLNEVLTKYVRIQEENGHSISEEHYLIQEDEMEQAEDVEVPKALGDLFESVAGAIFLDSGMSLAAVWSSYSGLMAAELEAFSAAAPKSPVRELLEAEPDTAKFGKPERLADGRRVRVCVEVFGRGTFKGIGRNYRIAKGTAARCALRHLKNSRH